MSSISYRQHKGKWEYRIVYEDPFTQKPKEKSKRGFRTKPEARYAAQEMEKKLLNGNEYDTPFALKNYLREWLTTFKENNVSKNTYELHEHNVENHIIPYFKDINITDIKPMMYQKFINYLIDEDQQDYSKRTTEIIHGTMFNALNKAVSMGKLEKNPCLDVEIKIKPKKNGDDLKYMKSEDISLFLKTAYKYGYIYYIYFKTLINTGLRKGEAAALQWDDIDFKENKIKITKTLDFKAKTRDEIFGDTKTYHSKRVIKINKLLADDLRMHMKYQNDNKLILNEAYDHKSNLVFARKDGSFLPKSSLFNAFERILKRAGLQKLPIHSTRHTHAVLLLESKASMKYIQERLGHKSIEITADIYSHISDKIDNDSMDQYDDYMNTILE
ncbi:tyrosine-type recombinase/integrase [Tuberibacillus sp. Marseille-P3662]|uniref:tyrosine-type recombinase/integrase n=1 Tax=Tuberibacillus sp. Marseille-P3662 TaxID=1965358 RepID=UPI000A1CA42C|nr:tyrosine-type recombinase/integrase [Tuberibacillus sp. Marseille-P3662]